MELPLHARLDFCRFGTNLVNEETQKWSLKASARLIPWVEIAFLTLLRLVLLLNHGRIAKAFLD